MCCMYGIKISPLLEPHSGLHLYEMPAKIERRRRRKRRRRRERRKVIYELGRKVEEEKKK